LNRLHYITTTQTGEDTPIEIWSVLGSLKKINAQAKSLFQNANLVLLNPFPENWSSSICKQLDLKCENLPVLLSGINNELKDGFYYIPSTEDELFLNNKPIEKL
jgi:hypothetical protein